MRYLMSVIDDDTNVDTGNEMAAVDAFNDQLRADGYWVFADGLTAPEDATVVDNRGEQPIITDGPFIESKEFLGGFWIIDTPDLDITLKLAVTASKACNRKIEIRPFNV